MLGPIAKVCKIMVHKNSPPPLFPNGAPAFVTNTRRSALSVSRLTVEVATGEEVEVTMPAEDAFVVLYQLRDHPAHEFRFDGKAHEIGPTPRSTLTLVDLIGKPSGRLRRSVDTLFFHLPRAALDDIAEEAGAPKVRQLAAPEP